MNKYFKKFSIMFVMTLILSLGFCISAFADDTTYTENLIPTMTSDTSPSGQVFSSNETVYGEAFRAFDKKLDDGTTSYSYWTPSSINNAYIGYMFTQAKKISEYTIAVRGANSSANRSPKAWQFQGSNDGSSWITLDTRTEQTDWGIGEKRTYTFSNDNSYIYYQLKFTSCNDSNYLQIAEVEMMEKSQSINESISLDKSSMDLNVGDSQQLTATTTPAGAQVTWTSSDTSVATVDSTGKVTAIGTGTATITSTTTDGSNLSASCTVNVIANNGGNGGTTTGASAIVNIAYAKGDNTNNAGGDVSIIFNGVPDTTLSVVKTASVKSVWVGDTFTYTIVVTNTGSKTAKAVVINDAAPNHIKFMPSGITTTQGTVDPSSSASNIVVNVGDIPPAGTVTITVPATVVL